MILYDYGADTGYEPLNYAQFTNLAIVWGSGTTAISPLTANVWRVVASLVSSPGVDEGLVW